MSVRRPILDCWEREHRLKTLSGLLLREAIQMNVSNQVLVGGVLLLVGTLVVGMEFLGLAAVLPSVALPLAVVTLAAGTLLVGTSPTATESGRPA
jgi:hypothetical protein